jgi:hypothetical protein
VIGVTPTRKRIWVDLLLYPAHTMPTAAAPVMVGAALAAHDGVFRAGARRDRIPGQLAHPRRWCLHRQSRVGCGAIRTWSSMPT